MTMAESLVRKIVLPSIRLRCDPSLTQDPGVAGVGDRVADDHVVGRSLEEDAAVAVEQRIVRQPADRVALEAVVAGVEQSRRRGRGCR